MTIAMEQSQIDAYLERIHRFVESVNAFKDRLDNMLSAHTPGNMEQPESVSHYMETKAVQQEPVQTSFTSASADAVSSKVVTPDDIDIDAILNNIDIDGALNM